jgi:hypothetical protein
LILCKHKIDIYIKKKFVLLFFVLTQSKVTKERSRLTDIFCKSYDLIFFPEKELLIPMKNRESSNSFFLAHALRTKSNLVLRRKSLNVEIPFSILTFNFVILIISSRNIFYFNGISENSIVVIASVAKQSHYQQDCFGRSSLTMTCRLNI